MKDRCKLCDTAKYLCDHKEVPCRCRICGPEKYPHNWCGLCKHSWIALSPYKPYCFTCYCYLNPDAEIPRRQKSKELYLHQWLKSKFPHIDFVHDKRIEGDCSSGRRPDWRIDLLTHMLIIENDESEHVSYECENKRTMQLFQDGGDRPLVMIRFNPDAYRDETKHPSCFEYDEKNKLTVNEKEWQRRTDILEKEINQWLIPVIPEKEITKVRLFYSSTKRKFDEIKE
jgi:hypothetical protein